MTQQEVTMTVEHITRILSRAKISFTDAAAERFIIQHNLKRVPLGNTRGTSFNYLVSFDSLIAHLEDEGVTPEAMDKLIYGDN